jgi:hypothetical protein
MDPDPAVSVTELQDVNEKQFFSDYYFLKVHLHHVLKIKSHNEKTQKSRNQGFSYYFCLMIKESGSGSG